MEKVCSHLHVRMINKGAGKKKRKKGAGTSDIKTNNSRFSAFWLRSSEDRQIRLFSVKK